MFCSSSSCIARNSGSIWFPTRGPLSSLASQRLFPSFVGCGISRAVSRTRWASDGDAEMPKRDPVDAESSVNSSTSQFVGQCTNNLAITKIDISSNVFIDKLWKVLSPFCAANKTKLTSRLSRVSSQYCLTVEQHTSSASQLAISMLLRGFQPLLRRTPKPRITSCNAAVPLDGSLAPMTCRT